MEGKVVFSGQTEKGIQIIVRYPSVTDTEAMLDYINTLSQERTFIRFQGEKITLEYERDYVKDVMNKIVQQKSVHLLVFAHDKLIGSADINVDEKIFKHNGIFGITVAKEYRGQGIGKLLMQKTLEEAETHMKDLKLIILGAFANNALAITLYKRFGFKEYGRLPEGIIYKGEYIDYMYMYKKVR